MTTRFDKRFELGMGEDMRRGIDLLSRRHGLDASSWVRLVIATALSATLGDTWQDRKPEGEDHDH